MTDMWKISGEYVIWGCRDELLQEPGRAALGELRTCASRDEPVHTNAFSSIHHLPTMIIATVSMYYGIQVAMYSSDASHLLPSALPKGSSCRKIINVEEVDTLIPENPPNCVSRANGVRWLVPIPGHDALLVRHVKLAP
jgi:hypothetical protein